MFEIHIQILLRTVFLFAAYRVELTLTLLRTKTYKNDIYSYTTCSFYIDPSYVCKPNVSISNTNFVERQPAES